MGTTNRRTAEQEKHGLQAVRVALESRPAKPRTAWLDASLRDAALFLASVYITKQKGRLERPFRFGGDNWNRTSDPLHVKQVL